MQITRQADYAVRAVYYLSKLGNGDKAATHKIAEMQDIPGSFLAKIISQLSISGIVNTSRGARGGVSLAQPAENISLLDVVEAIDGPIRLNECVDDNTACSFTEDCPMMAVWCDAQKELVTKLRNVDFASI